MFVSNGSLVTKTPVTFTTSSWFPSMPPMSSSTWPSAYSAMYRQQLWVYVLVAKLAKAQARLPLPVYSHDEMDRPRADAHPMSKLLANPNPGLSRFGLWMWTRSTRGIHGEAFWYKKRRRGVVVGLYPLHPVSMEYREKEGLWFFDNGTLKIDGIPDSDLVRFADFNPDSTTRGMSPLEPLRSTLENEWHARNATSSFWKRGARPGIALRHPTNISGDAQKRLKAQMDSQHSGSGQTGGTLLLEEGMDAAKLDLSAEEAQYIETRKLNREEVCAAYDVPPPVVHILDRATFSNITEQMRSMYRDTMAPLLQDDESTIEIDLRLAEWPDDDVYAEFLMDEVLRGDFEARADAYQKSPHMTIAEKRKAENLPFIEGTDRIFLNTATMPLDAIDAQSAAIVAQTQASDSPLAEVIPLAVARSVMGRLNWQQNLSDVDPKALTSGLNGSGGCVSKALAAEREAGGTVASFRERIRRMTKTLVRSVKTPDLTAGETKLRDLLEGFFDRQGKSVLAAGAFDTEHWDRELSADLHKTAVDVSAVIGKSAMSEIGYDTSVYDVARTVAFLEAVSVRLAANINGTTKAQYLAAVADPDASPADVFTMAKESRAPGIAVGVSTLVGGFAVTEAGKRVAEAEGVEPTKTWVTGPSPRPTHAAMDGQTVGIEETFSNGMQWPGESGPADETAGCNCRVQIDF